MPMNTWHAHNPEKGVRFAKAMESVSKSKPPSVSPLSLQYLFRHLPLVLNSSTDLDPGNGMIIDYLTNQLAPSSTTQPQSLLLIEINGKTGSFSTHLATIFPSLTCLVQDPSPALIQKGQSSLPVSLAPRISFQQRDLFAPRTLKDLDSYASSSENERALIVLLRSVLWNLPDAEVVQLLKSFMPMLDSKHGSRKRDIKILVSDLVSPAYGTFAPDIERERTFRRRDVTLMTMHNVQQRTAGEWGALIGEGVEGCEVCISILCYCSA